jgi:hypothetical protein
VSRLRSVALLAGIALACSTAAAGPLDAIYDEAEVAELARQYERGWLDNYENVFVPTFTPEEQARLDGVAFRFELKAPNSEPFGFMAGGKTVLASAASLRFLEDVAMAYTWLERKGYDPRSVGDYLLMLRYWDEARGRPPQPWDALCIPADAFDDPDVGDRARRAFDTAVVFVLLHELGHVFHRHPGNAAVPPEVSRVNEQAADRFALDLFARLGELPVGTTILFFTMAHLHENRADYGSDAEYMETLAQRTHPVSPERLQSLARHMNEAASSYERAFRPEAKVTALAIALEISQFAWLLGDPDVQRLAAGIGRTASPDDLAPRRPGRHLAPPCGSELSGGDFTGLLHGQISDGTTPLDVDVILRRTGDAITGAYSFGAGFGRLEGSVAGATLAYRWTMGADGGGGRLTLKNGGYEGTWGFGPSDSDGGSIALAPAE